MSLGSDAYKDGGTTRHHHTENLSGEICRHLPENIQRKGRAGNKNS